jgi:glycosyltransferase involved in cell wall biosynthesis
MNRVATALGRYAPDDIEVVRELDDADLVILHVIDSDAVTYAKELQSQGKKYAVVQYCLGSTSEPSIDFWETFWDEAEVVWSYYDLPESVPRFLYAPLGVDEVFTARDHSIARTAGVLTSGYVTGPGAEAIEEVAEAAEMVGMSVIHIGPKVLKRAYAERVFMSGISDAVLADFYRSCKWVSGLRFIEGFELPVVEGLACGARPVVFDRPDMRAWYHDLAVFVPECHGDELVAELAGVFQSEPEPVSDAEISEARSRFDWSSIVGRFWGKLRR